MCFSFLFFLVSYSNTLVHFFSIHPIPEAETDAAEKGDTPDTDSEMDSGEVETDNTDIDGSDELPDDFDVDAEMDVDIEADVENVPNEVLETDNTGPGNSRLTAILCVILKRHEF